VVLRRLGEPAAAEGARRWCDPDVSKPAESSVEEGRRPVEPSWLGGPAASSTGEALGAPWSESRRRGWPARGAHDEPTGVGGGWRLPERWTRPAEGSGSGGDGACVWFFFLETGVCFVGRLASGRRCGGR
jgi:hypothetical protein